MVTDNNERPAATPNNGSFDLNRPTIIGLLFLGSGITGITGIIGIVLAYVWKGEPHEPWEATHYTYLIRTFWIALIGGVIGFFLLFVLIGFLILPAVGIWALVRIIMSLINAQKRAPMPNPETFLV